MLFDQLGESGIVSKGLVGDSRSWRRNYTISFANAVPLEFHVSSQTLIDGLLDTFLNLACASDGTPLRDFVASAWEKKDLVNLSEFAGGGTAQRIELPDSDWNSDAQRQLDWSLAETELLTAARRLDGLKSTTGIPALIAFAGGAELSAVSHWLRWGGTALLLARTTGVELNDLTKLASASGGSLWVVSDAETGETGVDLVARADLAAAAIARFVATHPKQNFVFGHFGYAPGIAHLRLEAVAQALTELVLKKLAGKRLQFSWLATPTDSLAVPVEFANQRRESWANRSMLERTLEVPWRMLGYLKTPSLARFVSASGEELAVLDSAARLQGPSYSLAKRIQRWRASSLGEQGILTSYQITPPARTDSVLRHKILRSTYRGMSRFGVHPFDSYSASIWPAALYALDSLRQTPETSKPSQSATDWYFARAIHGGLWRTRYEASTIWVPATALGLVLPGRKELR